MRGFKITTVESRSLIFSNLPITRNKSRFPLLSRKHFIQSTACANILLEHGADMCVQDCMGKTPVAVVTPDFSKYPIFRTNFRFPWRLEKSGFNCNFEMIIRSLDLRTVIFFASTAI